jgi:hypothetical protein
MYSTTRPVAVIVDVETVANWRELLQASMCEPCYVVLVRSRSTVYLSDRELGVIAAARSVKDAFMRVRVFAHRRNTDSRIKAVAASPPEGVGTSRYGALEPRRTEVPASLMTGNRGSLPPDPRATTKLEADRAPSERMTPVVMHVDSAADQPLKPLVRDSLDTENNLERNDTMSIGKALEAGMKIDGAIAVAVADWASGLTLGTAGGGERLNIEVAASANCNVVKAKMEAMKSLGIKGTITDIMITLDEQIHIIRPLRTNGALFYYLAIDKARGNLGLARHRLEAIEKELAV